MTTKQAVLALSAALLVAASCATTPLLAQGQQRVHRPFLLPRGDTLTPAYEGWYPNPDGTISVSFGYYNRNADEVIRLPIGPDNRLEPESVVQGQPEIFQPRRHTGTFAVVIPAGYLGEVWWTLNFRGEQVSIPSNLGADYRIDALGPTIMGNTPPRVRFSEAGPVSQGPGGEVVGPLQARVGEPVALRLWVDDDGVEPLFANEGGEALSALPLASAELLEYRGPGAVVFEPVRLHWQSGENNQSKTATARFTEPGAYRLRVRTGDAGGAAGNQQCCWTNTYVDVVVLP